RQPGESLLRRRRSLCLPRERAGPHRHAGQLRRRPPAVGAGASGRRRSHRRRHPRPRHSGPLAGSARQRLVENRRTGQDAPEARPPAPQPAGESDEGGVRGEVGKTSMPDWTIWAVIAASAIVAGWLLWRLLLLPKPDAAAELLDYLAAHQPALRAQRT